MFFKFRNGAFVLDISVIYDTFSINHRTSPLIALPTTPLPLIVKFFKCFHRVLYGLWMINSYFFQLTYCCQRQLLCTLSLVLGKYFNESRVYQPESIYTNLYYEYATKLVRNEWTFWVARFKMAPRKLNLYGHDFKNRTFWETRDSWRFISNLKIYSESLLSFFS